MESPTVTINYKDIKMNFVVDLSKIELPVYVYDEYLGKKQKYHITRGENGFLKITCVENKK